MGILGALDRAYHAIGRDRPAGATSRAEPRAERQLHLSSAHPAERPSSLEDPLVVRIRGGDREAFNDLVRAYHLPLRNYVYSVTGSSSAAEEVVQDLFLSIWRMHGTWTVRGHLAGYLFVAAQKGAFHSRRKSRRFERWEREVMDRQETPFMGHLGEAADRQLEALELKTALARAIERLPLRRRQVAFLRFQQGMTCPEIARIMGVTVKVVERHAAKALLTLRTDMAPYLGR